MKNMCAECGKKIKTTKMGIDELCEECESAIMKEADDRSQEEYEADRKDDIGVLDG